MTEVVQPIDSICGNSLMCNIGNGLDILLMSEENLSKWEGKMTATELRILVTKLISDAQEEIMKEGSYAQWVGSFKGQDVFS